MDLAVGVEITAGRGQIANRAHPVQLVRDEPHDPPARVGHLGPVARTVVAVVERPVVGFLGDY
jgi:hypothetical protein